VEFTCDALPREIRREAASCLYAIAQEALLNISKHARAKQVKMHLGGEGANVGLSIADDGIGLPAEPGSVAFGLGIVNMRERARWARGSFSLESQPGLGTRIIVAVPAGEGTGVYESPRPGS
jgi:signal transduction histidine kinase